MQPRLPVDRSVWTGIDAEAVHVTSEAIWRDKTKSKVAAAGNKFSPASARLLSQKADSVNGAGIGMTVDGLEWVE